MFNFKSLYPDHEEPLDVIPADGGFCSIFRSIACVGDSLSSGEFVAQTSDGKKHYCDYMDYSWGQYISRMTGAKVYNFSKGGMTAKWYMETFAEENGCFDSALATQAYIIALGVNDILNQHMELGTVSDIDDAHPENNQDTFAGWYGRIIQKYKEISPDAKFFFVTMVRCGEKEPDELTEKHAALLYELAEHYSNAYVIDLRRYLPPSNSEVFKDLWMLGHYTPMGYVLTARWIAAYIDYIVRHNLHDFDRVGFINTEWSDQNMKAML